MTFDRPRGSCVATLVTLAVLTGAVLAAAENAEIAHRRSIERKTFSNAEIIDGFFKVTFGAEFHIAGGVDRIRKYDGPIRVYVDNKAKPDRSSQVAAVVADAGEFVFYDCIYEELLQSLGPINDDTTVPWSMFNDDVQMGFFDLYDQYLLNILYDRRIRPGMTRTEVGALLPEVLPQVRA